MLGKLIWSERCYRQALEKGEEFLPVQFLLGDVLLYEGRFIEASDEMTAYFKSAKIRSSEAVLKHWLASNLSGMFGNTNRNILESMNLVNEFIQHADQSANLGLIEKAISLDPLCGAAWLCLAALGIRETASDRAEPWLVAAILLNDDVTAWAMAVILTMKGRSPKSPKMDELELAVITEAIQRHGIKCEQEIARLSSDESELLKNIREHFEIGEHYFSSEPDFQLRKW